MSFLRLFSLSLIYFLPSINPTSWANSCPFYILIFNSLIWKELFAFSCSTFLKSWNNRPLSGTINREEYCVYVLKAKCFWELSVFWEYILLAVKKETFLLITYFLFCRRFYVRQRRFWLVEKPVRTWLGWIKDILVRYPKRYILGNERFWRVKVADTKDLLSSLKPKWRKCIS